METVVWDFRRICLTSAPRKTPKYSYSGTVTGSLNPTTVVEFTYGISHNLIVLRVSTDAATRELTGLTNFPLLYPDANYLDQIPNFTWGGRVANGPSIDTKSGSFEQVAADGRSRHIK